jgi:pimeloyl-ACP methyl ester carboxylesterase
VRWDDPPPLEVKFPGRDGGDRILTYEVTGDPDGSPVFFLHGMPGSSSGPRPRNAVLHRHGVKLISYNRPGYGRSTRQPDRTVADAATDVELLANHLGLGAFTVLGRSGGGPHALACAAKLSDRVLRAAVLVSFAPADAVGLDWHRNMASANTEVYREASFDPEQLAETLRVRANRVKHNPAHLLELLRIDVTAADARIIDDFYLRQLLLQTYQNAVADGPFGWIDDVMAIRQHWGFHPRDITVPVRLWHGADDQFAPPSHTVWLGEQIPNAIVEVQEGAAHFGALPVVPRLLEWLTAAQRTRPIDATLAR